MNRDGINGRVWIKVQGKVIIDRVIYSGRQRIFPEIGPAYDISVVSGSCKSGGGRTYRDLAGDVDERKGAAGATPVLNPLERDEVGSGLPSC